MRAIVSTPSGSDRVELIDDVAEPAPRPGEALVAVESFSVNRGELALLAARPQGWRPGQDVAGVVLAAAADGSGPPAGTRVVGLVEQAGWAQRVAIDTGKLVDLPQDVTMADAATLPIAGLTALRTLRLGGSILGRRVLITGAAGGVGHLQTQLAAVAGAQVVAVTRRENVHSELLAAGAHEVVHDVSDADGLFDMILEGVGGRSLSKVIGKAGPGSTIVLFGASDVEPSQLSLLDFFGHENAVIQTYFSYANLAPVKDDLAALIRLMQSGQLTVRLGAHRPWSEINAVLDDLHAGSIDGKAVLHIK